MQKKILTTFLIIFFTIVIFNINSVFGVGTVSQCWVNDVNGDGKQDLLFRTYTGPHPSSLTRYHNTYSNNRVEEGQWNYKYNGNELDAKWIYLTDKGMNLPSVESFGTIGFAFHTESMSKYSSGSKIGYTYTPNALTDRIETLSSAINGAWTVYAKPEVNKPYSDTVFYEVMRMRGNYSNINWGTGLKINGLYAVGQVEYRYTIVKLGNANIYVTDNIVYNDDLVAMVSKAKDLGSTQGCYVSNILISKAYGNNSDYEVSRTATDFLKQYDKHWPAINLGTEKPNNKSLQSAINLYDNKLIFPQLSKRTVLVRHINIGNNTTISSQIVNNGTRIASNDIKIIADNPEEIITGSKYGIDYSGYEEYYEGLLDIEQGITKYHLANTKTYKALGYNVGVANTEDGALANVQARINSSQFSRFTNGTTSVYVPGKEATADSDVVVIDIYYSEYDKDVQVNHLYVDKDGYVLEEARQNIKPNDAAIMNSKTISRINQDTYIRETYRKQLSYDITVRIADSLKADIDKNQNLEYRGYEVFTDNKNVKDLVGTQRTDLNKSTQAVLTSTNVQVNFYYYLDSQEEEQEPRKDIAGSVFVTTSTDNNIRGQCNDVKENITVTSIPSGSQATVGIKGIPKYMVGAITTKYVSPSEGKHTIDVTLKFSLGEQTKQVKYSGLEYRVGYYKVTDMAVYKLTNTTIYDANKGYDGTSGDSIFDWKDGKLSMTPKDMNLNIQLTGINNRTIANNAKAIDNVNNYVSVNIEDKHGNKSTNGTTTSTLQRTYLTKEQIQEVDANGDKAINNSDKTFADSELNRYNNILREKQTTESNRQTEYNNALAQQDNLKTALDNATKELNRRLDIYNEASSTKSQKLISKTKAENDLKLLEKELEIKKDELKNIEETEASKLTEKENAASLLSAAETEKNRLYSVYQESIKIRNELAAKVSYCEDYVEKDVSIYTEDEIHIYLEPDQIEALEQCKKLKEEYAKNLEDKIVENAKMAYENYEDNEYKFASQVLADATTEYNNAVTDRENKEKEINTLQYTTIPAQQILVQTIGNDYTSYVNEIFKPAKESFESYRDNEYKTAETNYNTYVEQDYVGSANQALQQAINETKVAQEDYNKYYKYRENVYAKYDEYKALYDEFMSITGSNENIAKTLGLKINILVQNMSVKVNKTELAKASSNTATYTSDLREYMASSEIPQIKTEIPVISKDVYSIIGSTALTEKDYDNKNDIATTVLNGVRNLAGKADYKAQTVIGSKSVDGIVDTVYYSDQSNTDKTVVFRLKNEEISRTYKVDTSATTSVEKYKNVKPINIYTPITVTATMESNTNQIVDQTKDTEFSASMIQINTPFTIDLSNDKQERIYGIDNTSKYVKGYYVKFDFDVHKVSINGKTYKNGNRIPAGTWIGIITKNKKDQAYVKAQAYGNVDDDKMDIISEENSSYTVRAVAYNATTTMLTRATKYSQITDMIKSTSDIINMVENICTNGLNPKVPSYFAEETYSVAIVNRAYDFRVTDVKDISWKSVFRKSTNSLTNVHTGNLYYSGTTKWNAKSEKTNSIISRPTSEIGRNPLRILPIGPYKSADTTYIKAPKLGYRFSFDMKVTGSYYDSTGNARDDKKVGITTKFYYISKNGKTYLEEYDGKKDGIYLFYKTSSGKYVKIDNNGGDYDLRFTPNDVYRYIQDEDKSTLSNKSISLGDLRSLTLTKDMATFSNNGSYITYYGEYKLPNSTIAVKVNSDGTYDINKPLKDGYIGVVFDIVAYSGSVNLDNVPREILLSYSKNTKENTPNTSQWDYEGFLGYTGYGNKVKDGSLSMKLEKGNWNITDDIYNAIKGTVMLYDIDQRAATDYE